MARLPSPRPGRADEASLAAGVSAEDALVESAQAFITRPDGTIALRLASHAEALLEQRACQLPDAGRHACEAGCAWCCHMPVSISMPEALLIHAHVTQTWSEPRRAELVRALADANAAARACADEDDLFLSRRPCPFLTEGHCSIYAVRPLACRGHASFSKQACAAAHESPMDIELAEAVPVDPELRRAKDEVKTTLGIVMLQSGVHALDGELASLLGLLVEQGVDAEHHWLAGADLVEDLGVIALSSAFESLEQVLALTDEI